MSSKEGEEIENDVDSPGVKEFCLITGATVQRARHMLDASNSDLQVALNLHLESGDVSLRPPSFAMPPAVEEDKVRAPDLPRQDILVDSLAAHNMNRGSPLKRTGGPYPLSVFDPFRNFEVEARRQEEMLDDPRPTRAAVNKIRRLEDLFRPPLEMIFHGSFNMARDCGVMNNKWLMVNSQVSTEFPCQVLNRDIWSDAAIKSIVEEHFVFWQVYADSNEGARYNQFYRVVQYPYVSVIDPRTGELLKKWHTIEKPFFAEQLLHFLQEHPLPSSPDDVPETRRRAKLRPSPKKQAATVTSQTQKISESAMVPRDDAFSYEYNMPIVTDGCAKKTVNGTSHVTVTSSVNSANSCSDMEDNFNFDYESGDCLYDSSSGSDKGTKSDENNSTKFAARSKTDESTNSPSTSRAADDSNTTEDDSCQKCDPSFWTALSLRFPNSHREIVKFRSSSKVKDLQQMLMSRGFPPSEYHYMTYFPKRKLNTTDISDETLTSLGLHNETVFIHAIDKDNIA